MLDAEYPDDRLVGELLTQPPIIVFEDNSLREAADHMVEEKVGSVAVVTREAPQKIVGVLTRGDLVTAHTRRLSEARDANRQIRIRQGIRDRLRKPPDGA